MISTGAKLRRMRSRLVHYSIRAGSALLRVLIVLLLQIRDRAFMALLISTGAGLTAEHINHGLGVGISLITFGSLSLILRHMYQGKE